jgi:hypothetical protein
MHLAGHDHAKGTLMHQIKGVKRVCFIDAARGIAQDQQASSKMAQGKTQDQQAISKILKGQTP